MTRLAWGAIHFLACAFVVLALVACGKATASRTVGNVSRTGLAGATVATQATNALALEMLPRLGLASTNAVFSPYSVQAALAMVGAGAAGKTASQLGRVLHAPALEPLQAGNATLAARLARATAPPPGARAGDAARLDIANGLFTQSGVSLEPRFAQTLSDDFGAAPQLVDFRSEPDAARQTINTWVAARTSKLINDLMPPGSITVQTALVLANAIYLRARWSSPFDPAATSRGSFFTAASGRVTAEFMNQAPVQLLYGRGSGYRALELPYLDSTLSMLVVMPQPGTLPSFERALSVAALARLQQALAPRLVEVRMPRFHLAGAEELNDLLAALGMPLAFTDRADFSGITSQARLKISEVQHAADLDVDEFGTVATAATGIALTPTAIAAPSLAVQLRLDHPFLLYLRDDVTGTILFAARVVDPTRH